MITFSGFRTVSRNHLLPVRQKRSQPSVLQPEISPVLFAARKKPVDQETLNDIIRKIIIADGTLSEKFPDLSQEDAFAEVCRGVEDSFLKNDREISEAQQTTRNAYRHAVKLLARGLKVKLSTLNSQADLRKAYLDRFLEVSGEAALGDRLRPRRWDPKYSFYFYVDRYLNEAIDASFSADDSLARKILRGEYSYSNGVVKSLHAPLIGVPSAGKLDEDVPLLVLRSDLLKETMGVQVPSDEEIQRVVQDIADKYPNAFSGETRFLYLGPVQDSLKAAFPAYFDNGIQEYEHAAFEVAASMTRMGNDTPRLTSVVRRKLQDLSGVVCKNKIRETSPEELIARFALKLDPSAPKALKAYLTRKTRPRS